jgi:drebrin-like protein
MVDEDWWMGENARGQTGLFPANYVELVEDDNGPSNAAANVNPMPSGPAAGPPGGSQAGPTATALYDYEAAGESVPTEHLKRESSNFSSDINSIFCRGQRDQLPRGSQNHERGMFLISCLQQLTIQTCLRITNTDPLLLFRSPKQEFPDEDWWLGEYGGKHGLFPANYVQLDE